MIRVKPGHCMENKPIKAYEPSAGALPRRPGAHAAGKYAGDRKTETLRPEIEANCLRICPPYYQKSGGIINTKRK